MYMNMMWSWWTGQVPGVSFVFVPHFHVEFLCLMNQPTNSSNFTKQLSSGPECAEREVPKRKEDSKTQIKMAKNHVLLSMRIELMTSSVRAIRKLVKEAA
jgi:hypothetical protein